MCYSTTNLTVAQLRAVISLTVVRAAAASAPLLPTEKKYARYTCSILLDCFTCRICKS
ncbi:hypothetical protein PF005_g267 [Phytophthora fragariae]|uniref:Uncharacterized protein n=2 Tax=Phytophthora TaxID=4783 RepID=A0A6A3ZNQ4_9STRA|nr:hypothetical protein PF003_g26354 [Phytophthora fragariae]KAE9040542.1 hypothetical protein PR002_g4916 [Phytophthora rubi]KAE8950247.1 hypothetical protein PF009_g215 [Phytophthora fragariae]KAE9024569.1 hypothetical protein PF011_g3448 [Phytophthora fragariae]KAE9043811.1 hypothetical protein PR001_g5641 [Phytophthora rubi]